MSSRNFRKVAGGSSLPATDSDDDYGPGYAQHEMKPNYDGFEVSTSESEAEYSEQSDSDDQEGAAALPKKVVKKKMNSGQDDDEQDEVERSVMEVNAIMGAPPPGPPPQRDHWAYRVLRIDARHLNVAYELRRLFGPEEYEAGRRPRPQPNRLLMLKRIMVHPNKHTKLYNFKPPVSGLTMAKYRDMNGRMYFIFNHSEEYKQMHRSFLEQFPPTESNAMLLYLDEARKKMHVEALMEISDVLFRMEDNAFGNEILENVVTFLQYVAHPLFNLSANNVRLEYKYLENRPFHVAMLKYMYLLSNKACHRTALEIAKMLLLLDPSDPLAILAVIDVLALRAREHEWLIGAIKYFDKQREAGLLYNIKYSLALSHFHVAMKQRKDFSEADKLLKDAILAHPQVLIKILECANISNAAIYAHPVFAKDPEQIGSAGLNEIFYIYAKLTGARWREADVAVWLMRNAKELCESYDKSSRVRGEAKIYGKMRHGLFQVWPPEYLRHIAVLSSLARLVLDGPLTAFYRPTCGWDPLYDKGVNRYDYKYSVDPPRHVGGIGVAVYSYDIRNDYFVGLTTQMSRYPSCLLNLQPADATSLMMPLSDPCFGLGFSHMYNEPFEEDSDEEEYSNYDYEDDAENFEQYEQQMAELEELSENLRFDEDSDEE